MLKESFLLKGIPLDGDKKPEVSVDFWSSQSVACARISCLDLTGDAYDFMHWESVALLRLFRKQNCRSIVLLQVIVSPAQHQLEDTVQKV